MSSNRMANYNIQCALNASKQENYLELTHPHAMKGLVTHTTPELLLSKKQEMQNLSEDARYIIDAMLKKDSNLYYQCLNDSGAFVRSKFDNWLHRVKGWSWTRIWNVRQELNEYTNSLE